MHGFLDNLFDSLPTLPEVVTSYPAMLAPGDKAVYFTAARDFYSGQGAIVDAGVFLGGTTKCLVEGLRGNKNFEFRESEKPITAFDAFKVYSEPYQKYAAKCGEQLEIGDSFRPLFDRLLGADQKWVDVREGDILQEQWRPDDFIEIAELDICKGVDLTKRAADLFFPHLRPYKSIVIHQDYVFPRQPQIAVMMEALSPFFVKIAEAASSAVFLCTKNISSQDMEKALADAFAPDNAISHMRSARAKAMSAGCYFILTLGAVRLLAESGDIRGAGNILDSLQSEASDWSLDITPLHKKYFAETADYIRLIEDAD